MHQPNNVTHTLRKFHKTIDLLIHDLHLEVYKEKKFKIYFDAADIVNAIEGMSVFYGYDFNSDDPKLSFNHKIFESPRTLVNSLAASGILGTIHLLLPHQGELTDNIKKLMDFGTNLKIRPDELADIFLRDTGFKAVEWEKLAEEEIPTEKTEEIVKQIPPEKAKIFFKAVQCLQPWHSRLLDMINAGILETTNQRVHYQPAGMFDLIFEIKEAFERRRPNYHRSNITDSLAMGALIEKVRNYKQEKSDELPCFFVSDDSIWENNGLRYISHSPNAFHKVASSERFRNEFTLDEERQINAIRNDDYFIFRATFVNKYDVKDSLNKLYEWREEISTLLKTPSLAEIDKKLDEIKSKSEDLKSWAHLIAEWENDSFFNEIWLPSEAPKKFSKAVRDIVEASEKVRQSQIVRVSANEQLQRVVKDWERQTLVFKDIRMMWQKLGTKIKKWQKTDFFNNTNSDEELEQKIFKEFGFFRYSFPPETRKVITSHLYELLQGSDSEREARKRFLFAYVQSFEPGEIPTETLAIVVSSLLIMENLPILKHVLSRVLYKTSREVHFSFKIVYGETLLHLDLESYNPVRREISTEVKELVKTLVKEFNLENGPFSKAKLARGIAYLYYWLWIGKGGEATWRKTDKTKFKKDSELQEYIDLAIDYAKKSYLILENSNQEELQAKQKRLLDVEKAYALNMYLYHLVEDDHLTGDRKNEITRIGAALEAYRKIPFVWQYRYDDTLGVYYAKLALMGKSVTERMENFNLAETRIKNAVAHIKKVWGEDALNSKDRDVREHQEEINILKLREDNIRKDRD